MIIYLDNMIVLNQNIQELLKYRDSLIWLLTYLGFVINWNKSQVNPCQGIKFLGFNINSLKLTLPLPKRKLDMIVKKCLLLIRQKKTSVRQLALPQYRPFYRPLTLQALTDGSVESSYIRKILQVVGTYTPRSPERAQMLGPESRMFKQENDHDPYSGLSDRHGCLDTCSV